MSIVQAKGRFLSSFDSGRVMQLKEDWNEQESAGTSGVRSLSRGAVWRLLLCGKTSVPAGLD